MGMSSVLSVSLISLSAAPEIRVRQTITWLLGTREAEYAWLIKYVRSDRQYCASYLQAVFSSQKLHLDSGDRCNG